MVAGNTNVGTYTPEELLAGDAEIITEPEVVVSGAGALAQYTVVGKVTASSKLVAHNPAAVDGSEVAYGILTEAVDATAADVNVAVYTGGYFNHAQLVWDATLTTLEARKAEFKGTPVHIGEIRL